MSGLILSGLTLIISVAGTLAADDTLRFIVVGDNGASSADVYTSQCEKLTAHRMAKTAEDWGLDFIVLLGDNFYNEGVKNIHDPRFRTTFEEVYNQTSLQVPWYVIAGNHDHYGNVSAQIAYSKLSSRWHFPDLYYSLTFEIPGSDATIDLIMIDTVTLCGHSHDDDTTQPTAAETDADSENQWRFIANKLSSSRATYLWTMGHYPIYSIAWHGPTSCLVQRLLPLLYKYKANGHMCGHDHNLQYLQETENGHTLDFIVSGVASRMDPSQSNLDSVPPDTLKFNWADLNTDGGFVYVEVTATRMVSTFIDSTGAILYQATSHPRNV